MKSHQFLILFTVLQFIIPLEGYSSVIADYSFDDSQSYPMGCCRIDGRKEKGLGIHAGKTALFSTEMRQQLKNGTIELWLSQRYWNSGDGKSLTVLSLMDNRQENLTLYKAAEAPLLMLKVGGKVLAQVPVYDWYQQPWLLTKENRIHLWHLVTITWDEGKYALYLDGSRGEEIGMGNGPSELAFDRIMLGNAANPHSLDVDELKIISQTIIPEKIASHYTSLYYNAYNYLNPRFAASYTVSGPKIDGRLTDEVWKTATCIIGLNKQGTWLLQKEVKIYCAYDKDTLYFGFSVPHEGTLKGSNPPIDRDLHQDYADNIELFLDPSVGLEEAYYQFTGNCFGSVIDRMGLDKNWNGNWTWKTHMDSKHWTAEMAIPFAILNKPCPSDGGSWGINICAAMPWMNWAAAAMFHDRKSFGLLLFDQSYPVIRMDQLSLREQNALTFGFTAMNPDDKPQILQIEIQIIPANATKAQKTKELKNFLLAPGKSRQAMLDIDVKDIPRGTAVFSVRLADGNLINYQRFEYGNTNPAITAPPKKQSASEKTANPAVIQKESSSAVEPVKKLSAQSLGEAVLLREKWQDNSLGKTHKVYPPWTPVTIKEGVLGVWGRNYRYIETLLPARMSSQTMELLSGPIVLKLRYAGKNYEIEKETSPLLVNERNDDKVVFTTEYRNAAFRFGCLQTLEFDGMLKVDLEIESVTDYKRIDSLQLDIPLDPLYTKYYHVIGDGNQPPLTDVGLIPEKGISFPFKNMVWLGTEKIGLCWFTEDQKNWNCDSKSDVIQIVRKNGKTVLQIDIINRPLELIKKRTITFGLMATPVKEREETWRQWHIDNYGDGRNGAMAWQWFWGPESYTLRPDYEYFTKIMNKHLAANRPLFITSSLNYLRSFNIHCGKYFGKSRAVDNLITPEYKLWGREWLVTRLYPPNTGIFLEDSTTVQSGGLFKACPASAFQDYYVYMLKEMIEKNGVNALYLDQPMVQCGNSAHGCGYHDASGIWRSRMSIFSYREMLKRIRNVLYEKYGFTRIMFHCSNQIIVPVISFADIFLDGENYNSGPLKVYDHYSKVISLPRYRIQESLQAFGPVPFFLSELSKNSDGLKLESTREMIGFNLLHDVYTIPFPKRGICDAVKYYQEVWRQFCGRPGIKCYPYWENDLFRTEPAAVKATGYVKGKEMLIVVVNTSPDKILTGRLSLNPAAVPFNGLKSMTVHDAYSGEKIETDGLSLFVAVRNLDFRLIKVEWQ